MRPLLYSKARIVMIVACAAFALVACGVRAIPHIAAFAIPEPASDIGSLRMLDVRPPARLRIPAIDVDAALEMAQLTPNGAIGAPKDPLKAAWFAPGPRPGEAGSAVITGHFGWKDNVPAVFNDLSTLRIGDRIYLENTAGMTTTFVVREMRTYGEDEDASVMFVPSDGTAHLSLVTCQGDWDSTRKSYSERLVVFADKE